MANENLSDLDAFGEFGVPAHVIQKGGREQIRISLSEFKSRESIHIRSFYDAGDGYRPTRRGVTIPVHLYGELLKGVIELGTALGVIDPESYIDEVAE